MNKREEKNLSKMDLLINLNPKSRFAEAIKLIRTNLSFSAIENDIKAILITSPEEHDGKSFIAANLAAAYSLEGKKVLIIDCDLRKGRLHKIFDVLNKSNGGLSNLILNYKNITSESKEKTHEKYNLNDYIVATDIKDLYIIPSGPCPPNPIELLSGSHAKKIFTKLKNVFDIIIFDGTPILGLSDALVMTKYSDANIVVVSNKKTKEESIASTIRAFEQVNSKITGVVLNRVEGKNSSYYSKNYFGE